MISKKVDYRKRKTNETFFGMPFLPLAIFLVLVLILLILPPANFVSEQNKLTGNVVSDISLTNTRYTGNENLVGNLNLIFNRGDRIPQSSNVEFKITALPSPINLRCPSYYVCENKETVPEQIYNSATHVCEDAGTWTSGPWEVCGDTDYNDLYDCSGIGKKCCPVSGGSGAFYTNAQCSVPSGSECRDICSGTVNDITITLSDAISRSTTPTKGNLTSGAFRNVNGPSPSGSGYGFGACGNLIREPAKQVTGLALQQPNTDCQNANGICINPEMAQCPSHYILDNAISCGNSLFDKCCIPQLPDLTVLSIDYYPSSPEQTDSMIAGELQATIDNVGNTAVGNPFSVVACLYDPSQVDNLQTFAPIQPPSTLPPNCYYATTNPITPPVQCSSVGGTCIPNTAGCTGRVDDTKACQSDYYCCIPMNQQPPQVTTLAVSQPPSINPPHYWPPKMTVSFGNRNVANKIVKVTVDYHKQVIESDETNNYMTKNFVTPTKSPCELTSGTCVSNMPPVRCDGTIDPSISCNDAMKVCCMPSQPPTITCNDTDNPSYNIYVQGTCKDNNPLPVQRTDNCQAATQLQEYYCGGPMIPGSEESCLSEIVACPYGCENGACKQQPVTNYTCVRDGGTCIDEEPPYQCSGYIDTGKTCAPAKICCMPGQPPANYSCSGWNNLYAINLNQITLRAPAAAGNYSLNVSVTYASTIETVVMTWDDVKFSVTGTTHKKCVNYKCIYVPGPGSNSCSSNSDCNHSGGGGGGCIEDWTCYPWGSCVNGQRTRSCTDNNDCGTYTQRPPLWEVCQSGCLNNWQCSDWTFCQQGTQQQSQRCEDMNRCDTINYSYTQTRDCCVEEWDCKWSLCSGGVSTKVCTDKNNCGTEFTKPASETKKCTASFFTILGPWTWLILIVLVLAILTILFATKVIPWPFKPGAKKPESGGSYPELNSYIKNAQSAGDSKDAIRKKLVEAGWPKDVVDDSLKSAKK